MEPLVKIEGLKKTYRQGLVEVPALQGIDLTINKGDFLAFAGPSGSGKTTLLNLVGGLMSPTEGRVLIEGQDLAELSPSALSDLRLRRIGFIFQAYNLIPVLTAYENTEFVMMLQKVDETVRREKCMGLLKTVGLEGMESRYPRGAVRRAATTGRHRPGDRRRAGHRPGRRTDRQPGQRHGGTTPGHHGDAQPGQAGDLHLLHP